MKSIYEKGGVVQMNLSIVIVTYNSSDHIVACLQSIVDFTEGLTYEIIAVDNASSDKSELIVRQRFPSVRCIQTGSNLGFTAASNIGMRESIGDHIILLNPDTQLMNNALFSMVDFLRNHPEAGAVGGLLMQDETTPIVSYHSTFPSASQVFLDGAGLSLLFPNKVPSLGITPDINDNRVKRVASIAGADLMFRRTALEKVGYLDERFFLFTQEVDWCFRLTKETGLGVYFLPKARIRHILGASVGQRSVARARMNLKDDFRFIRKNYGFINLILVRVVRIMTCSLKISLALLRYCLNPGKRNYWKGEVLYYATMLKVSSLPDRMVKYLE